MPVPAPDKLTLPLMFCVPVILSSNPSSPEAVKSVMLLSPFNSVAALQIKVVNVLSPLITALPLQVKLLQLIPPEIAAVPHTREREGVLTALLVSSPFTIIVPDDEELIAELKAKSFVKVNFPVTVISTPGSTVNFDESISISSVVISGLLVPGLIWMIEAEDVGLLLSSQFAAVVHSELVDPSQTQVPEVVVIPLPVIMPVVTDEVVTIMPLFVTEPASPEILVAFTRPVELTVIVSLLDSEIAFEFNVPFTVIENGAVGSIMPYS